MYHDFTCMTSVCRSISLAVTTPGPTALRGRPVTRAVVRTAFDWWPATDTLMNKIKNEKNINIKICITRRDR